MCSNLIYFILPFAFCLSGYEKFQDELGPEKTKAMNVLIETFDGFLIINFPESKNQQNRIHEFLEIFEQGSLKSPWKFNAEQIDPLLEMMENSGLRKDIYLFKGESYEKAYDIEMYLPKDRSDTSNLVEISYNIDEFEDIFPPEQLSVHTEEEELAIERRIKENRKRIDNSPVFNVKGYFLYALAKSNLQDTSILKYVDLHQIAGDISPSIIASGYLNNMNMEQYTTKMNKMILAVEIYLPMILYRENIR